MAEKTIGDLLEQQNRNKGPISGYKTGQTPGVGIYNPTTGQEVATSGESLTYTPPKATDSSARIGDYVLQGGTPVVVPNSQTDLEQRYLTVIGGTPRPTANISTIAGGAAAGAAAGATMLPVPANVTPVGSLVGAIAGAAAGALNAFDESQQQALEEWKKKKIDVESAVSFYTDDKGDLRAKIDYEEAEKGGTLSGQGVKDIQNIQTTVDLGDDGRLKVATSPAFAGTNLYKSLIEDISTRYAGLSKEDDDYEQKIGEIRNLISGWADRYRYEMNSYADYKQRFKDADDNSIAAAYETELGGYVDPEKMGEYQMAVISGDGKITQQSAKDLFDSVLNMDKDERNKFIGDLTEIVYGDDDKYSDSERAVAYGELKALRAASANVKGFENDKYNKMLDADFAVTLIDNFRPLGLNVGDVVNFVSGGQLMKGSQEYLDQNELAKTIGLVSGPAVGAGILRAATKLNENILKNLPGTSKLFKASLEGTTGGAIAFIAQNSDDVAAVAKATAASFAFEVMKDAIFDAALAGTKALVSNEEFLSTFGEDFSRDIVVDLAFQYYDAVKFAKSTMDTKVFVYRGEDGAMRTLKTDSDIVYEDNQLFEKVGSANMTVTPAGNVVGVETDAKGSTIMVDGTVVRVNKVEEAPAFKDGVVDTETPGSKDEIIARALKKAGMPEDTQVFEMSARDAASAEAARKVSRWDTSKPGLAVNKHIFNKNAGLDALNNVAFAKDANRTAWQEASEVFANNLELAKNFKDDIQNGKWIKSTATTWNDYVMRQGEFQSSFGKMKKSDFNYLNAKESIERARLANAEKEDDDPRDYEQEALDKNGKYLAIPDDRARALDDFQEARKAYLTDFNRSVRRSGYVDRKMLDAATESSLQENVGWVPLWGKNEDPNTLLDSFYGISQTRKPIKSWIREGDIIDAADLENPLTADERYTQQFATNMALNYRNMMVAKRAAAAGTLVDNTPSPETERKRKLESIKNKDELNKKLDEMISDTEKKVKEASLTAGEYAEMMTGLYEKHNLDSSIERAVEIPKEVTKENWGELWDSLGREERVMLRDELAKVQPSNIKYEKLIEKAKNYKTLDRFKKMNNPIKGSEIWGEKPTGAFQRDNRAVRINLFPGEAVRGIGLTRQYLLNLLKDAYDQGVTNIVPSYGSYTKEGISFMDYLAEQGWVVQNGRNGYKSYEISSKIKEWSKVDPLADIYEKAKLDNPSRRRITYGDYEAWKNVNPELEPKFLAALKKSRLDSLTEKTRRMLRASNNYLRSLGISTDVNDYVRTSLRPDLERAVQAKDEALVAARIGEAMIEVTPFVDPDYLKRQQLDATAERWRKWAEGHVRGGRANTKQLRAFVESNMLVLPDRKGQLAGKVKHALWEKVKGNEPLPKIEGLDTSAVSPSMDKQDFYKMLDETPLFQSAVRDKKELVDLVSADINGETIDAYKMGASKKAAGMGGRYPISFYVHGRPYTRFMTYRNEAEQRLAEEIVSELNDKELLVRSGLFSKFARGISNTFMSLTTALDPSRVGPNVARDTVRGEVFSGAESYINAGKVFKNVLELGDYTKKQKEELSRALDLAVKKVAGDTYNSQFKNPKNIQTQLAEEYQDRSGAGPITKFVYRLAHDKASILAAPSDFFESFTRRRLAKSSAANALRRAQIDGKDFKHQMEDMLNAANFAGHEYTANFLRKGETIGRLSRYVPYLGSAYAGVDSLKRAYINNPKGVTQAFSGFLVAYLTLLADTLSDEESRKQYHRLSEYDRAHSIVVSLGDNSILTIPLDEQLASFVYPYRRILETLNGTDPVSFWEFAWGTLTEPLPMDLSGFSEGGDFNLRRGLEKLAEQHAPRALTSFLEVNTGYDLYYGSTNEVTQEALQDMGIYAPTPGDYTTASKNSATLRLVADATGIPQWQLQSVVSNYGGNVGSYVLNTIDKLGGASKDDQGGKDFMDAVFKSFVATDSDNAASQFYEGIQSLKEDKRKVLQKIYDNNEKSKTATGQELVKIQQDTERTKQEYATKVADFVGQYLNAYEITGGLTKSQANQIFYLFVLGDNDTPYDVGTPAEYYGNQADTQLENEASRLSAPILDKYYDQSKTGIYQDADGNWRVYAPYGQQAYLNTFYGQGTKYEVDLRNILEGKQNSLKGAKTAVSAQRNAAFQAKNWDEYNKLAADWDKQVIKAIAPYIQRYGAENVLTNTKALDYLEDWFYVPDSFIRTKNNRYVSLAHNASTQRAFARPYIKYLFGLDTGATNYKEIELENNKAGDFIK